MTIDIQTIRADTPACESLVHFNNAGCSLMPRVVKEGLFDYLTREQTHGGYETAGHYREQLNDFYVNAARLINCQADEIAHCESNSRGWQLLFHAFSMGHGDNLVTTRSDYGSNFASYIQASMKRGIEIRYIDTLANGDLDLSHLERILDQRTRLVSMSHIPTGCGIVHPAEAVGALAEQAGVPFLLDACQSIGHVEVDVQKIRCDALTVTGRKYLRGPRGSGFLYASRKLIENAEPVLVEQHNVVLVDDSHYDLQDSARRFENFECHMGGKYALGLATDYAHSLGMKDVEQRIVALAAQCRKKLESIPGVTLYDLGERRCGIVTFQVRGQNPDDVRDFCRDRNINIWVSDGPGSLVDFAYRGISSLARASLHYYNTSEEIDRLCGVIEEMIDQSG